MFAGNPGSPATPPLVDSFRCSVHKNRNILCTLYINLMDVIKMLIEKCDEMAANVRVWTSNKPSKLTGGYFMCFSGELT